jgi:chromosomal replication initiation ATPase DnaA
MFFLRNKKESNSKEIPQLKILKPRPTPDAIIQAVFYKFGCGMEIILRKGKKRNLARDVAIYLCREMTGETSGGNGDVYVFKP